MESFFQSRSTFKSKSRESRDNPSVSLRSLPEIALTTIEEKLINLGLNPAAQPGEVSNAGAKLFHSLRKRGVSSEQIISSFAQKTWAVRELSAARGRIVDFGRYRGKTVGEVPPHYLRWALRNCDNLSFNLRRAMQLVLKAHP
jgi:hypothetical protein